MKRVLSLGITLYLMLGIGHAMAVCSGAGGLPFDCDAGVSVQSADLVLGGATSTSKSVRWSWLQIFSSPAFSDGLASPPSIGGTIPNSGAFTNLSASNSFSLSNNKTAFAATYNYPGDDTSASLETVLGSLGAPSTTNNAAMICQKWGGGAVAATNPCLYLSSYKTAAGSLFRAQGGFVEVVDLAGWDGTGTNNFIETLRTQALLGTGTHLGSAYGFNSVAAESGLSGTTHKYLIGNDSDLYNYSLDATTAFDPTNFEAGYLAESSGTKLVRAAFMINPYLGQTRSNTAAFIDGFYVPPGAGGVTSPIVNSAFRSDAQSIYGLDLTHAPNSYGAIGINNNTPIRAMNAAGNATVNILALSNANNVLVCGDVAAAGCKIGVPGLLTAIQGTLTATDVTTLQSDVFLPALANTPGGNQPVCVNSSTKKLYMGVTGSC